MAENFDLIFGSSASQSYSWNDSDYQNGWQTVGDTPPTREQFDALQRRNDTKAQELNSRLSPLEEKATADGRQTATAYAKGAMVTADGLPNGWLLECVVPGTTGAGALDIPSPLVIGGTIVDGTVTWKLLNLADKLSISDVPKIAGFSGKQTFTSSGTFTPTVTGNYKITLQGGGGGGGASGVFVNAMSGGGGGQGGHGEFYERLTAGTTYTFTIGAGGAGGASQNSHGSDGGASSITVGSNEYVANGGQGGFSGNTHVARAGQGGTFSINGTITSKASSGGAGTYVNTAGNTAPMSGVGGGDGGAAITAYTAVYGGGGAGGDYTNSTHHAGGSGGNGYITFEWQTASLV
jgi:hypothetical protein